MGKRFTAIILAMALICAALTGVISGVAEYSPEEYPLLYDPVQASADEETEAQEPYPDIEAYTALENDVFLTGDSKDIDPYIEDMPDLEFDTDNEEVMGDQGEPAPEDNTDQFYSETEDGDKAESGDGHDIGADDIESGLLYHMDNTSIANTTPGNIETANDIDPKDCPHSVTITVLDREASDIQYTDLHDGTHSITGKGVLVELCADCGMIIREQDSHTENCTYRADSEASAICEYCGHIKGDNGTHEHDFSGVNKIFPGELIETIPDRENPEIYHVKRFRRLQARKCTQCEAYETPQEVPGEVIETRERHDWADDGHCRVCGYQHRCLHDQGTFENTWNEDDTYVFINASFHRYTAMQYTQKCCALCGQALDSAEVQRISTDLPHRYVDGRCVYCGYVNICEHPNMRYTYAFDRTRTRFAPVNALEHSVSGGVTISEAYCPDCGLTLSGDQISTPSDLSVDMPHRFDADGVCMDCGYTAQRKPSECDHPEEYRIALDPGDIDALKQNCHYSVMRNMSTATEHVLSVEYDPSWVCGLCGHREDLSASTRTITISEPHHFYKGYCITADCGYKCGHSVVRGGLSTGEPFYECRDGSGHYKVTPTLATGYCELCGEYVKNHVVAKVLDDLESHDMVDGVCRKCGYECPHPEEDVVRLMPMERSVSVPFNEYEHITFREQVTETLCKACGCVFHEELETLSEVISPHVFENGVCADCGYEAETVEENNEYLEAEEDASVDDMTTSDEIPVD